MNQLAIVIPYYKIDFFEETLKSVAQQTDKRFTLYIGNDASPNDPLPLIQQYFPDGKYHYFNYQENLGGKNLAMQWERILENVQEDWFQILGDDDMIADNFVEEFYKNLPEVKKEDIKVIKVAQKWVDEKNGFRGVSDYQFNTIENVIPLFILKLEGSINSSLSEHIFELSSYKKVKFYHISLAWGTDDIAVLEIADFRRLFYISNTLVNVRISSSSISGSKDNEIVKNKALDDFYAYVFYHEYSHFNKDDLNRILKCYLLFCWRKKRMPGLNLFKIYWIKKDMKGLLSSFYKYYLFYKNYRS